MKSNPRPNPQFNIPLINSWLSHSVTKNAVILLQWQQDFLHWKNSQKGSPKNSPKNSQWQPIEINQWIKQLPKEQKVLIILTDATYQINQPWQHLRHQPFLSENTLTSAHPIINQIPPTNRLIIPVEYLLPHQPTLLLLNDSLIRKIDYNKFKGIVQSKVHLADSLLIRTFIQQNKHPPLNTLISNIASIKQLQLSFTKLGFIYCWHQILHCFKRHLKQLSKIEISLALLLPLTLIILVLLPHPQPSKTTLTTLPASLPNPTLKTATTPTTLTTSAASTKAPSRILEPLQILSKAIAPFPQINLNSITIAKQRISLNINWLKSATMSQENTQYIKLINRLKNHFKHVKSKKFIQFDTALNQQNLTIELTY